MNSPNFSNGNLKLDQFLVCGLGYFGQHCVVALKEFGVNVLAIEKEPPSTWELPTIPDLLDDLIVGDCRRKAILEQAKIKRCRAALLVTSNEQVNIETALAIRRLNPQTRLVVRSATNNLNQLLGEQLGNFIAYEPTELPTNAFALSSLSTEILGFFQLDGHWFQVIDRFLEPHFLKNAHRSLEQWNRDQRRVLFHITSEPSSTPAFHQWHPEATLYPGDRLVYIEASEHFLPQPKPKLAGRKSKRRQREHCLQRLFLILQEKLHQFLELNFQQQIRGVAFVCSLAVLILLAVGTFLYKSYYPGISVTYAFYATAILLLGGFGDIFGNNLTQSRLPWWLELFSLGLTLLGTAFVGVLYALLTEMLLSAKFQLNKRRPTVPVEDHIVIIGLSRLGQKVAALLHRFQQSIVGVSFNPQLDRDLLPEIPLIVGNLTEALNKANLATATSIVVVTDNEMQNLEVALMAGRINPSSNLVIQTYGQHLGEHLQEFLPRAQVLGTYPVAAEVFTGAAFGENIISLFRLHNRTILVTEYQIEAGDTLNGLSLQEVALGYGVVPILHQRPPHPSLLMPAAAIDLKIGDRLVVLATIEGLQWIEIGKRQPTIGRFRREGGRSQELSSY